MIKFNRSLVQKGGDFYQTGISRFRICFRQIPNAGLGLDGLEISTEPVLDVHIISQLEGIRVSPRQPGENNTSLGWAELTLDERYCSHALVVGPDDENRLISELVSATNRFEASLHSLFDFAEEVLSYRIDQWNGGASQSPQLICPGCDDSKCLSIFRYRHWKANQEGQHFLAGSPCTFPPQFQDRFDQMVIREAKERCSAPLSR